MENSEEREANVGTSNIRRSRQNYPNQNYRPPHTSRGRGRHDPHVAKALHNFGVSDLRELLDRKHEEQEIQTSVVHSRSRSSEYQPIFQRFENRSKSTEHRLVDNIQVELSTSTGHRNLIIDQDKKLPNIKHFPDHDLADNIFARGRGRGNSDYRGNWRGRGGPHRGRGGEMRGSGGDFRGSSGEFRGRGGEFRGRGGEFRGRGGEFRGRGGEFRGRGGEFRGRGAETRGRGGELGGRGRYRDNSYVDDYGSRDSDYSGRGTGNHRGRRGRGHRGNRGRGQRYSRDEEYKADPISSVVSAPSEIITEENWDDESFETPGSTEPNELETCGNELDNAHHDKFENYVDEQTFAHVDNYANMNHNADENLENYEDNSNSEIVVKEEDNLIITYPTEEKSSNRVVRFSLPQSDIDNPELNDYSSEGDSERKDDLDLHGDNSALGQTEYKIETNTLVVSDVADDLSNLEIKTEMIYEPDRKKSDVNENMSEPNLENSHARVGKIEEESISDSKSDNVKDASA